MTEQKRTTRKPRTTKTVTEKTVETPVVEETKIEIVKEEIKPQRAKKINIDRDEMIPVRSLTDGGLVYISNKSGARYIWSNYGDVEYIDFGEILTMRSSQPKFINDALIVIEDDEVVEFLGLTKMYENLYSFNELDEILNRSIVEIQGLLPKMPNGIKKSLATRARKLIENGEIDGNNKIKILGELLDADLKLFLD